MALLTDPQKADCANQFTRDYFVGLAKTADLDVTEIQTLVSDLDTWLDANATAANNAITLSVRTKASPETKYAALAYVALKRAGVI